MIMLSYSIREYVEICKKGYKDFNFDEAILDKAYSDTCKNIKKTRVKKIKVGIFTIFLFFSYLQKEKYRYNYVVVLIKNKERRCISHLTYN